ncbi:GNAT family N-acetyltransferase [Pseudalkalibacillus berkeleyi]|uniref:GNAT family N-acetyltransferase n=1 Tax=Pseudalkalibacillus berkeleyi TaxID=1069813 RepID=A0ABS9GY71_9BACL|nr:GNAT family N-acetyltransferase [Pseudalkalibacillus berkeleyi]MCF6137712.1 GNAT family N-acetyltransferase [Pseudalkalibacillus berkeleyi]
MKSTTTNSTVQLIKYNHNYDRDLSNFHLPNEQLMFTALPLQKINDPNLSDQTIHILILKDDKAVGYFALEQGSKLHKYSSNENARLLTAFSINKESQGNGLAKSGLKMLPSFISKNFPNINEVVLGVNQKNSAAISLYLKTGFVDNNEIFNGPKGPQHILHLSI